MSGEPTIRLNGEPRSLESNRVPLKELLRILGRDPKAVAVELNGEIVRRERWEETEVVDGDRLEIVQFVQGGVGADHPAAQAP